MEPLPGSKADRERHDEILPYWAIISKELRGLGLTKAEFAIFCNILSRAGWNKEHRCVGVCNAGTRLIAWDTRTHPDYVREVISYLLKLKLITRVLNPGRPTEYRPADKLAWLAANPHGLADQTVWQYEETKQDVAFIFLWKRLFAVLPGARKLRYERRMKSHPDIMDSVLAHLEDSKRQDENAARTRRQPVKDYVGLFEFKWRQKIEANRPSKK